MVDESIDATVPHVGRKEKDPEFEPPHSSAHAERLIRTVGTAAPKIRFIDDPKKDRDDPELEPPEKRAAHANAKKHKSEEEIACYNGVVHNSNMAV